MAVTCRFPKWRIVSTDLDSNVATILDKVASDRHVHPVLNVPLWGSFTVPSDSPLVNIPFPDPDDDPYVAEGSRLIYMFRQESDTPPYFQIRAAGISLQVEDTAMQDDARTKVTFYDPWKYLYYRPAEGFFMLREPFGPWDGVYSGGTTTAEVVLDQLSNTILQRGTVRIDAGPFYGGTGFYAGTIFNVYDPGSDFPTLGNDWTVGRGFSVGDVWSAMVNTYTIDLVLRPIWDPVNRPGYTHELDIYPQAGEERPDVIFSWDKPPKSVIQISRTEDGTQRATNIALGAGIGGQESSTTVGTASDVGEYWSTQFLPAELSESVLNRLAEYQLALRANGRTIVQFSPTPNRSACPFLDYNLGDEVFAYASKERFRKELGGAMRIYGFPLDIADDATEEIKGMILLPTVTVGG